MRCRLTAVSLCLFAMPAAAQAQAQLSSSAQDERGYCPVRPGLGTPACTIAPGRVSIETGVVDWTRDDTPDERSDAVLVGDTLVRVGLSETVEAQLGWTPFGHVRTREKATGAVDAVDRVGDVQIAVKANLRHPDGSGFSAAVQPFVTLPVGRGPLGAGDWAAGAIVPVSFDLGTTIELQLTPEINAAADEDRHGRHLSYSGVAGLELAISEAVNLTLELAAAQDDDPDGHSTELQGAASASWMPSDDLQLDIGTTLGLNRDAADVEVYLGISRRL